MGEDDYDVIEETVVEGEGGTDLDPDAADGYEENEGAGEEERGEGTVEEERRPRKARRTPVAPAKTATPVWVWALAGGGALVAIAAILAFLHAREARGPVMANGAPVQSVPAAAVAHRATSGPASPITFETTGAPAAGAPFSSSSQSVPGVAMGAPPPVVPAGAPLAGTGGGGMPSSGSGNGVPSVVAPETAPVASGTAFPGQGILAPSRGDGSPMNASAAAGTAPGVTSSGATALAATLRANLTAQQKTLKSILTQLKALRASLRHPVTRAAAPAGLILRLREQRDTAWRRIRALSDDRDTLRLEVARLKERLRLVGAGRRIFQGWRLIGVSNSAAILRNGQGALRVVTPGHAFGGVKILAIDAANLSVRTSAGRIPLPAIRLP